MAVYDLEEQEQLDELKAWWRQYDKLVILAVVVAVLAFAGFKGWSWWRLTQALEANELYVQLKHAEAGGDRRKLRGIAGAIVEKYPRTAYAGMAALAAAKAAFAERDLAEAKARLQWVMESAREDEMRDVARLRLAAVLLDENKIDEALRLLEAKHAEPLAALYADLKGDILVAQGKLAEARGAYQLALDKSDAGSPYRALLQIKLDALGDAK